MRLSPWALAARLETSPPVPNGPTLIIPALARNIGSMRHFSHNVHTISLTRQAGKRRMQAGTSGARKGEPAKVVPARKKLIQA